MENKVQPLLKQLYAVYGYIAGVKKVSFGEIGALLNEVGDGLDYASLSNGLEVLVHTKLIDKTELGYADTADIRDFSRFCHDLTSGLQLDDSGMIADTFDNEGIKNISPEGDVEYWKAFVPKDSRYLLPYLESLGLIAFTGNGRVINIGRKSVIAQFIVGSIRKSSKRRKSLDTLMSELESKRQLGAIAESIAMTFEKKRLATVGASKEPELISNDYVNAGYDMLSYANASSKSYDRFIEVKAVGMKTGFYLSRNELEQSRALKESYYLYLVDVAKSTSDNPVVEVMSNPSSRLFGEDSDWLSTVESYRFERIGEVPASRGDDTFIYTEDPESERLIRYRHDGIVEYK